MGVARGRGGEEPVVVGGVGEQSSDGGGEGLILAAVAGKGREARGLASVGGGRAVVEAIGGRGVAWIDLAAQGCTGIADRQDVHAVDRGLRGGGGEADGLGGRAVRRGGDEPDEVVGPRSEPGDRLADREVP